MTENHHQDKEMLDEIERVLNHQAPEKELLTTLSQTVPKANTNFQNDLENNLIAQLTKTRQKQETGEEFMKLFDEKSKRKNQPSRLPFTLVAAVIAIALVGGLIFFTAINNSGEPYNADSVPEGIALTATQLINDATATSIARNTGQSIIATETPDAFLPTATAIVGDATATAMAYNNENLSNSGQDSCYYIGLVENYAVNEGDTLFSIAENFEVDAETVITANCLGDSTSIQVGQILQIPIETVPVVIAIQDIPAGVEITSNHVTIINFPASSTPSNVFSNIDDVVGLIAQTTLRGEGAIRTYLVADTYREDFLSVVIALRDIELNETITDDMVTTVQYDLDDAWALAENNRGAFYYNNEGVVIGQRASTFIPYHQPVHSNNVTEAQNCQHAEAEIELLGCSTIDYGYTIMTFTTNDAITDATPLVLPLGTRVDVIAALQFIDIDETPQLIVDEDDLPLDIVPFIRITGIVSDAILLNVEGRGDDMTVTLALLLEQSSALQYMLEADVPLHFVTHVDNSGLLFDEAISSPEYPLNENGLAIISIPLAQINTDNVVNMGDTLDIQFSIFDADGRASALLFDSNPASGDVIVFDNLLSQTYLEIHETQVIYVGRGTEEFPNPADDDSLFMAIAVNPDDAWIVNWYIYNGANFNINP